MTVWLPILALAYLLGSIPFGYILVRLFRNEDIRATGSGNIGATNVARSGAKGLGIATLVLDAAKGYAAVALASYVARRAGLDPWNLPLAAGVAVVTGHMFPVWLRFQGGKGIATALGVFIALSPVTAAIAFGIFLLVAILTRYVSLASIIAAASVPVLVYHFSHSLAATLGFGTISLMAIAKHHANIARLLRGTESKFGAKKAGNTQPETEGAA